eukprot:m.46330 g.46330  ORF g.46330 m.46330 type:complete len:500 (-) comp15398_c0_seq1:2410-3909(-)
MEADATALVYAAVHGAPVRFVPSKRGTDTRPPADHATPVAQRDATRSPEQLLAVAATRQWIVVHADAVDGARCRALAEAIATHLYDTRTPSEVAPLLGVLCDVGGHEAARWVCNQVQTGGCWRVCVEWISLWEARHLPRHPPTNRHQPHASPLDLPSHPHIRPVRPSRDSTAQLSTEASTSSKNDTPCQGATATPTPTQTEPSSRPDSGHCAVPSAAIDHGDTHGNTANRNRDSGDCSVVTAVSQWLEWAADADLDIVATATVFAESIDWEMLLLSKPARCAIELYRDCGPLITRAVLRSTYELGVFPHVLMFESHLSALIKELCNESVEPAARVIAQVAAEDTSTSCDATTAAAGSMTPSRQGLVQNAVQVRADAALMEMGSLKRIQLVADLAELVVSAPENFIGRLAVVWAVITRFYLVSDADADTDTDTTFAQEGDVIAAEVESFVQQWILVLDRRDTFSELVSIAARLSGQSGHPSLNRVDSSGALRRVLESLSP